MTKRTLKLKISWIQSTGRRLHYLVKWKGFPDFENSWEPLANIPACGLVKEFHRRNPGKPGEPRRLISAIVLLD